MKKGNRKNIGYKKERVVLSDILPYEVPPFFSNRHFYNFLIVNKIKLCGKELRFKKDPDGTLEKIIRILFGFDKFKNCNKTNLDYDFYKFKDKEDKDKSLITIPFKFKITHKDNDYRELAVIHPINQLELVNFYEKYKFTILKYADLSRFSLRKPSRVASLKYFKDNTNKERTNINAENEIIETSDKEYTSLKTFFSYKKYSNIFKFYESYDYQKSEKRFDTLLKFDISRCFDSIYTHTLPWALTNKKIIKDNLGFTKDSFGGKFDKIMQQMNYNETNGIVIGPEFSRIFAELILQKIDKNVEKELFQKGYKIKEHFDIFRYVDDYFVFYTDEKIKNEVLNLYKIHLQEYNLFFNESKTKTLPKPIITNITIAKEEIRKLVEQSMILRLYDQDVKKQMGLKYYTAKDIITNYKLILTNTRTSYKDLQNYFLAIIFNKLKDLIKQFQQEQKAILKLYDDRRRIIKKNIEEEFLEFEQQNNDLKEKIKDQEKNLKSYYSQLYNNFNEIIELTFFIYSVLPRVTYSIKVCHILFRMIDFIKNQEKTKQIYHSKLHSSELDEIKYIAFSFDKKHILFKRIYDGILNVFKRNTSSEYAEVETLYLLPIINELGSYYQFDEKLLKNHFNISNDKAKTLNCNINYFTVVSLLNHIKRDQKFNTLRDDLQQIILKKSSTFEGKKAEDIFLLIDVLTCPYVANTDEKVIEFRLKVLNSIKFFESKIPNVQRNKLINDIGNFQSNWFCKWKGQDLGVELNTKRGHEVY